LIIIAITLSTAVLTNFHNVWHVYTTRNLQLEDIGLHFAYLTWFV